MNPSLEVEAAYRRGMEGAEARAAATVKGNAYQYRDLPGPWYRDLRGLVHREEMEQVREVEGEAAQLRQISERMRQLSEGTLRPTRRPPERGPQRGPERGGGFER